MASYKALIIFALFAVALAVEENVRDKKQIALSDFGYGGWSGIHAPVVHSVYPGYAGLDKSVYGGFYGGYAAPYSYLHH